MNIIARFPGPRGEICILEEPTTGARLYREGGVNQSYVLPGGETGTAYIRLMAELLLGADDILLLGCGGGALGSMLHRRGRRVSVVDVNPSSFELARTFFWMPRGIECIAADMRDYLRAEKRTFDAIGIDVGGPRFSYEKALRPDAVARVRRLLRDGGRIAVNISCETPDDPVPARIADVFAAENLEVWLFKEDTSEIEANVVILASTKGEAPSELSAHAGKHWSLARLGCGRLSAHSVSRTSPPSRGAP